ncbi:S-adenosyl-L-methionine-dependent tRNA 4-demethylwyosine synthase [Amaranthus tricolor]|uniref:S-adenosyl-L-methionine-dependent tRNA 4-demethylwyosine synthase n=1 Tax=Amaranthus tricolor TaxID=29722 RepID=UPI00258AC378|nr:S-adenosyl-L-methionine-dependent tRNA 4-demethylwyosine synthase [Amaranthus tricolor]
MDSSYFTSRVTLLGLLSITTLYCFYKSRSLKLASKNLALLARNPKLIYITQTGTSKTLAYRLHKLLASKGLIFDLIDVKDYEPEDIAKENLVVIVTSTWEDGKPPPKAKFFVDWIEESVNDFRVGALLLSKCKFAVFGVGSGAYGESFNVVARGISKKMKALGANEVVPLWEGDVDCGGLGKQIDVWGDKLSRVLKSKVQETRVIGCGKLDDENGSECADMSDDEEEEEIDEDIGVVDLEDIAGKGPSRNSRNVVQANGVKTDGKRDMVTPVIRANLEKQGYKIIGSHSGVKLCRWTKSQLRGRGGCYKHSFYGIESHRCMEATPSLACANKCVFCWRHHTNPVGKSWQWKMDDPVEIVNTAIDLHTKMIKQMKGVPGVQEKRLSEGLLPRHCALSLVGEPIMYPEINSLVDELHRRRISTFLVTNAQFPEKIKMLKPITQLYVSVDAATKESLKAVDRPLFGDFWERFVDSLTVLRDKHQRTVYRLTLVKGWNADDVDGYFKLVSLGSPDFIEIKGVTYCGSTATSKLTMENVPWHSDVKAFSEAVALKSEGEYEVACEHEHSCCVLLAKTDKFKIDGQWFTWIDYEKFQDLVASGEPFKSIDYMAPTPSWAVYGAAEGGFDPQQARFRKERNHKSSRQST